MWSIGRLHCGFDREEPTATMHSKSIVRIFLFLFKIDVNAEFNKIHDNDSIHNMGF